MKYIERYLGFFPGDNEEGRWFATDESNYTRFFDTGYRQLIHKRSVADEYGNQEEKWVVSMGLDKFLAVGHIGFNTTAEAKAWANGEGWSQDEEAWVEFEADSLMKRKRATETTREQEYNPGF